MIGISIREFARREECNDKLVRRAIEQKKLVTLEDGKLDPSLVGSEWCKKNRNKPPADKGADKSADKKTVRTTVLDGRQRVERVETPPPGDDEPALARLEDFIEKILRGDFASLADAERIKENGLALRHLLDGRKKAGELIEAATAETVLFEVFRGSRDAWLGFPSRVGPLIAAELGVEPERVVEALTAHVHQQLNDLGEPEADFGGQDNPLAPGGAAGVDAAATH